MEGAAANAPSPLLRVAHHLPTPWGVTLHPQNE